MPPFPGSKDRKRVRCKWYNDLGHPRINPDRQARGWHNTTGCTRSADKCWYAHPDHPDWRTAALSPYPQSSDYPVGRLPPTPEPVRRKRSRSRTPDRHVTVKEEPRSPAIYEKDRSVPLVNRVGPRRSVSPYEGERHRDWHKGARSNGHPSSRDYSRHSYGHSRERERGKGTRNYDRDKGFDRERDRDRGSDSSRPNSVAKTVSADPTPVTPQSPPRPTSASGNTGSVLDRILERDPGLGIGHLPAAPKALQGLLTSLGLGPGTESTNVATPVKNENQASGSGSLTSPPQPPMDPPPPSIPPPPSPPPPPTQASAPGPSTIHPPSLQPRSSISSSTAVTMPVSSASNNVPPESTLSTASNSGTMPPPPAPMSVTSTLASPPLPETIPTPAPTNQYTVPSKPTFLDEEPTPKREELTREERAAIWEKRIELLSEGVSATRTYNEQLSNVRQLQSLAAPGRTSNLPPNVRDQMNTSLQNAQAQADAAQERIKAAKQKLLELDFWPVRRQPEEYDPTKGEPKKAEEANEEVKKLVEDEQEELKGKMNGLSDAIVKLDRQMKEVALLVSARSRSGGSGVSTSATALSGVVPMDWEPLEGQHGLKRRKTGDDGAYISDSASATLGPLSPSIASGLPASLAGDIAAGSASPVSLLSTTRAYDYRLLSHRLSKLESSYHELENLFHQDEAHRQDELVTLIDAHVEQAREDVLQSVGTRQSERVKALQKEVDQMDRELQELAGEVAELIERVVNVQSDVEKRLVRERAVMESEREKLRSAIEENASRTNAMQVQLAANIAETQSLRAALSLVTQETSSTSAPAPPQEYIPTIEDLTQALLPRLLDAVRADIEQRLQDQKGDVIKIIRENVNPPTASLGAGAGATQQQMGKIREMVDRVGQLPEVLGLLQRSGLVNSNGMDAGATAGLNGSNNNGVNPGMDGLALQVNGNGNTLPSSPKASSS